MSNSEFFPQSEEGTNERGIIATDLENVVKISVLKDKTFSPSLVQRQEIHDFGDQAFLLNNLLTKSECEHLITEGEHIGFGKIKGSNDNYRSAERCDFMN